MLSDDEIRRLTMLSADELRRLTAPPSPPKLPEGAFTRYLRHILNVTETVNRTSTSELRTYRVTYVRQLVVLRRPEKGSSETSVTCQTCRQKIMIQVDSLERTRRRRRNAYLWRVPAALVSVGLTAGYISWKLAPGSNASFLVIVLGVFLLFMSMILLVSLLMNDFPYARIVKSDTFRHRISEEP